MRRVNKDQLAYVYRHRRLDTNEVFYIGIGVAKRRSVSKHGRNRYWHNIVNKHGYYVEIVASKIHREDAKELEEFMISLYGRRDRGCGTLVNMTDGGDGNLNPTKDQRKKMSLIRKGIKRSEDTKIKMSKAQSRGKHSQARKVINIVTGKIYECIKDAAEDYHLSYHSLKDKLSNRRGCLNDSDFRYYEDSSDGCI